MSAKISTRDSASMIAAIAKGQDFQTHGALSGIANPSGWIGTGEMPPEHRERLNRDLATGNVTYVIYSYQTPIAWKMRDGSVRRPRHRYSVTTSQHQGKAGYVLGE